MPANAIMVSGIQSFYTYTDEIIYACETGYVVVGSDTISCTLRGEFEVFLGCRNINECADLPCDNNARCDDTDGSFTCTCNTRYSGDGFDCTG